MIERSYGFKSRPDYFKSGFNPCPTIIQSKAEQQVPLPPKHPPQDRTAEEEGRKAEKAGKELKDNPYEKGTRKHSQWEAGWWTSHDSFFGTS